MAATAATCHSHRGGKEKRDHGDEDAAAAHGSLHRRSVARHGARRGVYRKHQKWASGSGIELVRLSRLRSGAAGGGFRAMMEAHRFSSSVMSFRGEDQYGLTFQAAVAASAQASGDRMSNMSSPYSQGRQPCSAFTENRINKPKACPICTATVQWCGRCSENHHSGGWQTCPGRKK